MHQLLFLLILLKLTYSEKCSSSYLSYTIPTETSWIYTSSPLVSLNDDDSQTVPIGFQFSFYGYSYQSVVISSNGFLSFFGGNSKSNGSNLPTIDTGESIWIWLMDFSSSKPAFSNSTIGSAPNRIFVVQFQELDAKSYNSPPDLCSDSLTGQVRLYEEDWSIEIEIRRAPILDNGWVFTGIHSDRDPQSPKTIFFLPPTKFNHGGYPYDSLPLGSTINLEPNPGWARTQCPMPIAARFECRECINITDCSYPPTQIGENWCTNYFPTCSYNTTDTWMCEQPYQRSQDHLSVTALEPRPFNWLEVQSCKTNSLSCCPFGPPTYYPPQNLLDECDLENTLTCYESINLEFCSICHTIPSLTTDLSRTRNNSNDFYEVSYLINQRNMNYINNYCGILPNSSNECIDYTISDWPDFPFIIYDYILHDLYGKIDVGVNTDYSNNRSCSWIINLSNVVDDGIIFKLVDLKTRKDITVISIYDSNNELLGTFSGDLSDVDNVSITTSTPKATVTYSTHETDEENQDSFTLIYSTSLEPFNETTCNVTIHQLCTEFDGVQIANQLYGFIGDGSKILYPNNADCFWNINIPQAIAIKMTFCYLQTEDGYDEIFVNYDEFILSGDKIPDPITTNNSVSLEFYSDESNVYEGFLLFYSAVFPNGPTCPCTYCSYNTSGGIECICYPGYDTNNNCSDINECNLGLCNKTHGCTNYPGGYSCQCNFGTLLDTNTNTCDVISDNNICADADNLCHEGYCVDNRDNFTAQSLNGSYSSFSCVCESGMIPSNDRKKCIYYDSIIDIKGTLNTDTFALSDFCPNPDLINTLETEQKLSFTGCNAKVQNDPGKSNESLTVVIKRCQFPFYYLDMEYFNCSYINSAVPVCATEINENGTVKEFGNCTCPGTNTNVALQTGSASTIRTSAFVTNYNSQLDSTLIDGNKDNYYLFTPDENWWLIITPPTILTHIILYGCPSCYSVPQNINNKITLYLYFFSDLITVDPSQDQISVEFYPINFYNETIFLPKKYAHKQILFIALVSNSEYYLSEIEVYANIPRAPPIFTECSLKLQQPNSQISEMNNINNIQEVFYKKELDISYGFISAFSFMITPDSRNSFAFVIRDNVEKVLFIEVLFDGLNQALRIEGQGVLKNSSIYRDSISMKGPLSVLDGKMHYCTISSVVVNNDVSSLTVYLDNSNPILTVNVSNSILQDKKNVSLGFMSLGDQTKKRSNSVGTMQLYWWSAKQLEVPDSTTLQNTSSFNAYWGLLILIIIPAIIFLVLCILQRRNEMANIDSLPLEMKEHYLHYKTTNHLPMSSWVMTGDTGGAHFFSRLLKKAGTTYNKMFKYWDLMGGGIYEIEEAYALHCPSLLNSFANKFSNLKEQYRVSAKVFVSVDWKRMEELDRRNWINQEYQNLVTRFPWNQLNQVPVIIAAHGTDFQAAEKICKSGFAALCLEDDGFYGKGIYNTTRIDYTHQYIVNKANPTILLCFVITGNAYPVVEHPNGLNTLRTRAIRNGYQSHYVLTRLDGYPCPTIETDPKEFFDEIVIDQESSILPYYMVKLGKSNFGTLTQNLLRDKNRIMGENKKRGLSIDSKPIPKDQSVRTQSKIDHSGIGPLKGSTQPQSNKNFKKKSSDYEQVSD